MNKKLIALAVGSALGAAAVPAFAQSSQVTLSGTLNYFYGYFDNGGNGYANTTAGSTLQNTTGKVRTDAMANSESEWALSGQENLGGGLSPSCARPRWTSLA